MPSVLTSGARDDVQMPNVAEMLSPVGHVDGDDVHLELVFQRLIEVLWRWLSPKPWRIRRWCS